MSIDRCRCGNLVDTDAEPEAYVEVGTETICRCRGCRDRFEEEAESRASEPRAMPKDWEPTAAQQAAIDAAEGEEP